MAAGSTTWSAPACFSFLTVLGCSALAMISSFGQSWRPVKVMKTFSASCGIAETKTPGAADSRLVEDLLLGRVARHAEEALRFDLLGPGGGQVHDDEGLIRRGQLVADQGADAAVAGDDRVSR